MEKIVMKNEENLKMNRLDDMELERVVGGTYDQSMVVAGFLKKTGHKDMFKKDGSIDGLGNGNDDRFDIEKEIEAYGSFSDD